MSSMATMVIPAWVIPCTVEILAALNPLILSLMVRMPRPRSFWPIFRPATWRPRWNVSGRQETHLAGNIGSFGGINKPMH